MAKLFEYIQYLRSWFKQTEQFSRTKPRRSNVDHIWLIILSTADIQCFKQSWELMVVVVGTYQMSKSIFQSKLPIPLFKLLKSIFYPNEICTFKYTHMQFPFLDREGGILISDICSIIIYVQRPLYKCSSAGLHRIKSKLTFHNAPSIWTGISIKVNLSLQLK